MQQHAKLFTLALVAMTLVAPASAYTGPGLGMATITVVLGFIASIFIALFAIIWYPVKRMMKRKKAASTVDETPTPTASDPNTDGG